MAAQCDENGVCKLPDPVDIESFTDAALPGTILPLLKGSLEDENGPVSETRLQGKFVLLYFSAGWCPPCRAFSPQLSEFRKENEEDVEESTNTAPLFPCLILLSLIRWCL